MPQISVHIFLAEEDPTFDFSTLPDLRSSFPDMSFEVLPNAGLALMFQHDDTLIPWIADAARRAAAIR